ncbi:sigma-70 family RNA polymerase sigma factor [Streptomyces lusitanus]|uniref:Sigma-70 family RNA polymerase sigma factor n=1 Tax=Streptomyces lusitanus TaxID=68232 RepID=A0ABU3JPY7_9ACTN|nr:sigma-70 family RNA polymerase sigma factor [Streptomyces lusitanus]
MTRWSDGGSGSSDLRSALRELLTRLRGAAVDGVVPEGDFVEGVRALALGEAERERLRHELARLGLPVRKLHVHAEVDPQAGEKVARDCGESMFPRLAPVRGLLARYADDDGYVTPRALDGVVRLAGLNSREAGHLRATTPVRPPDGPPGDGDGEGDDAGDSDRTADASSQENSDVMPPDSDPEDTDEPDPGELHDLEEDEPEAPDGLSADHGDLSDLGELAEAMAAAHSVLETDRRTRHPAKTLLSAQAEVGLAVLVRGGPHHMAQEPDEDELRSLPVGDLRIRARNCLVEHNQRLVHSIVRGYVDQGLDYEDLAQHGCLGLLRAARKFDPSKGFKFSTYATWWIRQSVTRAIADEGALIRVPVHMHEQMRKVAKAERELAAEGRRAGDAEVAVRCDVTLQKVQEIRRLTHRTDSLDRVIGDGATLADLVAETHVTPPLEKQVVGALYVEDVLAVVDTFSEREARILVRRLGLDGDEPSTLDDLGREFGVTRERIRQIEGKTKPVLRLRLREAGLVGLDAACEEAERAAERAAEARRAARIARATHAARTARARAALRKARTKRGDATAAQQTGEAVRTPAVEPQPDRAVTQAPSDAVDSPAEPDAGSKAVESESVTEVPTVTAAEPDVAAADWERARALAEAPVDHASWLVDYARAALGEDELTALLGLSAAAVARDAHDGGRLSRPVLTALEVLRRVFDALVTAGQQPGDFFDRPAEALVGVTPRDYLLRRPLVNRESRLAVRDALREYLADAPVSRPDAETAEETPAPVEPEGEAGRDEAQDVPVAPSPPAASSDRSAEPTQATADWDKALDLVEPPLGGTVAWRAEYALLALGHLQLSVLLGPSAAHAVMRAARHRGSLDRPVVQALDTLVDVFTVLRELGLRPEHFFEEPADRLAGATPRAYLATAPLVSDGARQAIGDALREFTAARSTQDEPTRPEAGTGPMTAVTTDAEASDGSPAATPAGNAVDAQAPAERELPSTRDHDVCEARLETMTREFERRLAEERNAAEERAAAQRAEAERELEAWEDVLLARMDAVLLRRERRIRAAAEARIAEVTAQHHDLYRSVLDRAEKAEEIAGSLAAQRARAETLETRLRDYREGAEARIAELERRLTETQRTAAERERAAEALVTELVTRAQEAEATATERVNALTSAREEYRQGARLRIAELEARLRDAEDALEQRDRFVEAARRHAEEAEQQAAQRIAQSEHNAWLRITDLQNQLNEAEARLAATQDAERSRGLLRDRWRRTS